MSTIKEQLARLNKALTLVEGRKNANLIPPQVLEGAQGVLFFKKLPRGKQSSQWASGIFLKRRGYQSWTKPVCVHMSKGDLYWPKLPRVDRTDVLIILTDADLVQAFEMYGQLGFSDETNKLKKGVVIENNEGALVRFATVLSERPSMIEEKDSFSFGICDGQLFSVHIDSPKIKSRDSSNFKFYMTRQAVASKVWSDGVSLGTNVEKANLLGDVHSALSRHFNVRTRFPEYNSTAPQQDTESGNAGSVITSEEVVLNDLAAVTLTENGSDGPKVPPRPLASSMSSYSSYSSTGSDMNAWESGRDWGSASMNTRGSSFGAWDAMPGDGSTRSMRSSSEWDAAPSNVAGSGRQFRASSDLGGSGKSWGSAYTGAADQENVTNKANTNGSAYGSDALKTYGAPSQGLSNTASAHLAPPASLGSAPTEIPEQGRERVNSFDFGM